MLSLFFFFQAEDGIRDMSVWLEFRRVLFRSDSRQNQKQKTSKPKSIAKEAQKIESGSKKSTPTKEKNELARALEALKQDKEHLKSPAEILRKKMRKKEPTPTNSAELKSPHNEVSDITLRQILYDDKDI